MTLLDQLTEAADALTEPHIHSEPIRTWVNRNLKVRMFRTVQPGLLAQLYQSVVPTASSADAIGGMFGSRPPLAIESLSRHDEISMAVLGWCRTLRLPLRASAESNIRALLGAFTGLDADQQRDLVTQMRRWWRWCLVLTDWEKLYQPSGVPCPVQACEQVNTLRINLTTSTAMCKECGATWSEQDGDIGVLADYIRSMTDPEKVA